MIATNRKDEGGTATLEPLVRRGSADTQRSFGEPIKNVEPGTYRHFTGELYTVVLTGLDTVTREECVVYKSNAIREKIYIAPLNKFLGAVTVAGKREVPRFQRVD